MSPRISVVIPTHNRADLLPRAVSSVLGQSFSDFELIVVDDGSTDNTEGCLERFDDPRLHYVAQLHSGSNPARNRGARASSGALLTFLDSDDEALPGWLAKLEAALQNPQVGIAFCGYESVGTEGRREVRNPAHLGPMWNDWTGLFNDGAFLVRREIFTAVAGYAEALRASQHSELGFRIVDHCSDHGWRPACVNEPLVRYFDHAGPRIRRDSAAVLAGTEYLLRHHRRRILRHPATYVEYLSIAGTHAARLGEWPTARRLFADAWRRRPADLRAFGRLLLSAVPPLARRRWPAAGASGDGA